MNNRGQAIPYFLAMLMVLIVCWALLINIAKYMKDRMVMRNAADNAALSVAVLRARTLNLLGAANYLMAATLSSGAFPCMVPVPLCNTEYVGGSISSFPFPFCDVKCDHGALEYHEEYGGVNRLRYTVETLQKMQQALIAGYAINAVRTAQEIARRQETDASGEFTGADYAAVVQAPLGVKRNQRGITYVKTINIGANAPRHHHAVWFKKWRRGEYSWYVAGDSFYRQKLNVVALKRSDSRSNAGYPLFSSIFGSWPSITASASAAVYNTKGAMMPEKEDVWTGIPFYFLPKVILDVSRQVAAMYETAAEISAIPYIGAAIGTGIYVTAAAVAAASGVALVKARTDRDTPSAKYEDAEYGGWDAHLVPANGARSGS